MRNKILMVLFVLCGFVFAFSHVMAGYEEVQTIYVTPVDSSTSESEEISANTKDIEFVDQELETTLIISDDANLLSDSEKDQLMTDMMPLLRYGNIVFKSIATNSSTATQYVANWYHQRFQSQSGTMMLIDMDNREIRI